MNSNAASSLNDIVELIQKAQALPLVESNILTAENKSNDNTTKLIEIDFEDQLRFFQTLYTRKRFYKTYFIEDENCVATFCSLFPEELNTLASSGYSDNNSCFYFSFVKISLPHNTLILGDNYSKEVFNSVESFIQKKRNWLLNYLSEKVLETIQLTYEKFVLLLGQLKDIFDLNLKEKIQTNKYGLFSKLNVDPVFHILMSVTTEYQLNWDEINLDKEEDRRKLTTYIYSLYNKERLMRLRDMLFLAASSNDFASAKEIFEIMYNPTEKDLFAKMQKEYLAAYTEEIKDATK